MMASSRAFASDAAGASASPPTNAGGSAPAVSLGSSIALAFENGTAVAADVAVDTQVQQWGYNVYAGSDTTGTATAASLVSLGVSIEEHDDDGGLRRRRLKLIPRNSGYGRRRRLGTDDDGEDDSSLTLILQNVRPVDYGDGASEQFVNLTCPPNFIGHVSAACPGTNSSVAVNCSGIYPTYDALSMLVDVSNEWSTQMSCAVTVQPSCLLWNSALQSYDSTLCKPVNWTSTNTTCACSAEASAIASEGGGASFTSGSAALAGYFASMFDPSAFGQNLFLNNLLLLATFGVIFILVVLNMLIGIRNDMRDNAASWTQVEVAKVRHNSKPIKLNEASELRRTLSSSELRRTPSSSRLSKSISTIRAETGVADTEEAKRAIRESRTVANYAETSVPEFVNDRSLCDSFRRAIVKNHGWVSASAWGVHDPIVPKYIRAQVFGISMLWLMVAVAVQTQLTKPDLGCDQYTNEADCLVMTSPFDPTVAACAWSPTIAPPCDAAPPEVSSQFTPLQIAMLVITMLCVDPFARIIEVLQGWGGWRGVKTRVCLSLSRWVHGNNSTGSVD